MPLWISITVLAALVQTLRNAAQRGLTEDLGTWGATLVRFLFGLPFAFFWLLFAYVISDEGGIGARQFSIMFFAWILLGAILQIIATALLLRAVSRNNFALGIAYSKTEVIQVALFAVFILAEKLSIKMGLSIALAFLGVMIVSWPTNKIRFGFPALFGLMSGSCFALSSVGYRGAAIELAGVSPILSAGFSLFLAQSIQTVVLSGWMGWRSPDKLRAVFTVWKTSLVAGFLGAFASALWFTAFAMEPVSHVRALGMVELLFGYAVSARFFRERMTRREMVGFAVLCLGLLFVVWPG